MHQYCSAHHENGMRRVPQRTRLLQHLGEGDLTTCNVQDAEEFVCMMYQVENVAKTDEASVKLFNKWKTLEALHPATDGLQGHIGRAQYQNLI